MGSQEKRSSANQTKLLVTRTLQSACAGPRAGSGKGVEEPTPVPPASPRQSQPAQPAPVKGLAPLPLKPRPMHASKAAAAPSLRPPPLQDVDAGG